jgi:hypothetical protein
LVNTYVIHRKGSRVAVARKITFDILNQKGNFMDIQKAFADQARLEGWKPHEIVGFVSESMNTKSLYPLAQCCAGITEEDLETLRVEYIDNTRDQSAGSGPITNVAIVNIDIPFNAMATFMIRWAVAAIPAMVILFAVGFTLNYVFTAFSRAVPRRLPALVMPEQPAPTARP